MSKDTVSVLTNRKYRGFLGDYVYIY